MDFCLKRDKQLQLNSCDWIDAERAVYEGTCEAKLLASEEKKKNKTKLTTTIRTVIDFRLSDNMTENRNLTNMENSTRIRIDKKLKSYSISMKTNIYSLFIISFISLLL
jgi:hypothetical protein